MGIAGMVNEKNAYRFNACKFMSYIKYSVVIVSELSDGRIHSLNFDTTRRNNIIFIYAQMGHLLESGYFPLPSPPN